MLKENVEAIVSQLGDVMNSKTIVGEPIISGNTKVIPLLTVRFGFGTGVGEGNEGGSNSGGKGGAAGAGVQMAPTALIVMQDNDVTVYSLTQKGSMEKLTAMIPEIMAKLGKKKEQGEACCS
jgi:uncharacterized spore protein YtfJ